jgi:hypothetical protein
LVAVSKDRTEPSLFGPEDRTGFSNIVILEKYEDEEIPR